MSAATPPTARNGKLAAERCSTKRSSKNKSRAWRPRLQLGQARAWLAVIRALNNDATAALPRNRTERLRSKSAEAIMNWQLARHGPAKTGLRD